MRTSTKFVLAAAITLVPATAAFAATLDINGYLQNRGMYSNNPKFADGIAASSNKGNFSFYANPSTRTGLGYSSTNYGNLRGKSDKGPKDADAGVWTRYRQWATYGTDDQKVKVVWGLEIGGGLWGFAGDSVGKSKGFGYSGDGVNVETRWLYTDFAVPGVGGRAKAGLQPVPLGRDFGPFIWTENAAGLSYSKAGGAGDMNVGWFRGRSANAKLLGAAAGDFYDDAVYLTLGKGTPTGRAALVLAATKKSNYTSASGGFLYDDNSQYLGSTFGFGVGNVQGKATAIYQGGNVNLINTPTPQRLDRRALLANVNLNWKPSAKHKLTAGYLYASGDGSAADNRISNYTAVDVDFGHGLIIFEGITSDAFLTDSPYWLDKGLNMPNVRYDYQASSKVKLSLQYSNISAAKNTQRIGAATVNAALGTDGQTYGKLIGRELDFMVLYQMYKGMFVHFGVGYLKAGSGLDAYTRDGAAKAKDIAKAQVELRATF